MARKSIQEILSAGPSASKFRDYVGQTLVVQDYQVVRTRNGESVQLLAELDGETVAIWAPSVVAEQVKELAAEGYLPLALRFEERESATGNTYFSLALPAKNQPVGSSGRLPMPEGEAS